MQDYALSVPALRLLLPDELNLLQDHLLRLSKLSRIMRFGRPVSDAFITDYCFQITSQDCAVYGAFYGGVMRGSAEIRFLSDGDAREAELIFSVEDDWQNAGLGSVLMTCAMSAARSSAINKLYLMCLRENYSMRRVLAKTGSRFEMMTVVKPDQDDPESYGSDVFLTFQLDTARETLGQRRHAFDA